jgi:hypothetical protein
MNNTTIGQGTSEIDTSFFKFVKLWIERLSKSIDSFDPDGRFYEEIVDED